MSSKEAGTVRRTFPMRYGLLVAVAPRRSCKPGPWEAGAVKYSERYRRGAVMVWTTIMIPPLLIRREKKNRLETRKSNREQRMCGLADMSCVPRSRRSAESTGQ